MTEKKKPEAGAKPGRPEAIGDEALDRVTGGVRLSYLQTINPKDKSTP